MEFDCIVVVMSRCILLNFRLACVAFLAIPFPKALVLVRNFLIDTMGLFSVSLSLRRLDSTIKSGWSFHTSNALSAHFLSTLAYLDLSRSWHPTPPSALLLASSLPNAAYPPRSAAVLASIWDVIPRPPYEDLLKNRFLNFSGAAQQGLGRPISQHGKIFDQVVASLTRSHWLCK